MVGRFGKRRDQRHRSGTAADDHHPLAGVGEIGRPGLGVSDDPLEVVHAGEIGQISPVVAVVAAAREDEAGGELDFLAGVGSGRHDLPAGLVTGPVGSHDAVIEPDLPVDAGF